MSTGPQFSVCIPNYNYGRYLGETIRSVLDQTFEDFEVVVVDNASTDDSLDVLRSFGDPRIRVFENRYNVGFAPNLQRVTEKARGSHMILLSSDDLMHPRALERYAGVLEAQGDRRDRTVLASSIDMVGPSGELLMSLGKPRGGVFPAWGEPGEQPEGGDHEVLRGREVLREALVHNESVAPFCATAYPKAMWEAVEGYDTTYHIFPDAAFIQKLLALDPDFVWVHERLFSYRVHASNQTAQAAGKAALKEQVDGYMRTVNFPDSVLEDLDLSREDLIRAYIRGQCVDRSLAELSRGHWLQGVKALCFAFATYPGAALRQPRAWGAAGLVALGPVGLGLARVARRLFHDG